MTPSAFVTHLPADIREAILQAAKAAPGHYGAHFGRDEDGDEWATVGPLAGGVMDHGTYDDFLVGPVGLGWYVADGRTLDTVGVFADAKALGAGLAAAIRSLRGVAMIADAAD